MQCHGLTGMLRIEVAHAYIAIAIRMPDKYKQTDHEGLAAQ